MLNTKMTEIDWNVENEIQLFYAMMGHKPVGVNKHFQMMIIHDKLSSSLNCELSTQTIWRKLETLYDMAALDESDKLPFPNTQSDFHLPGDFSDLLEDRLKPDVKEEKEEKEIRARGRPPKKDKDKDKDKDKEKDSDAREEGGRRDRARELREDDEDAPRRTGKRGRDSKPASPAHTSTSSKRRRN
ncbi:MRG/MORF4L-binding protein [Chionoecetes opilio]|uniref:MRG/MORF4L-binding protein n=1 Tax=Chionoecetes opilio TaxID=41210 RepID=A0A8J4Y8J8_CHIOP|nr:MRG/MORF4L-binding protein [Chionoecetes opilio]